MNNPSRPSFPPAALSANTKRRRARNGDGARPVRFVKVPLPSLGVTVVGPRPTDVTCVCVCVYDFVCACISDISKQRWDLAPVQRVYFHVSDLSCRIELKTPFLF